MKYRSRIIVCMLLLALLPLSVSSWLTYRAASQSAEEQALYTARNIMDRALYAYARAVESLQRSMLDVVSYPELIQYARLMGGEDVSPSSLYRSAVVVKRRLMTFYIANRDLLSGISLYVGDSGISSYTIGWGVSDPQLASKVMGLQGKPYWHVEYGEDGPSLSLGCAYLYARDWTAAGCVVLSIDAQRLFSALRSSNPLDGERFFVLDGDGRVIAHSGPEQTGMHYRDEDFFAALGDRTDNLLVPVQGEMCAVNYALTPYTFWRVFCAVPYAQFTQQSRAVLDSFLLVAVPCALLAVTVALLLARSFYRPIDALTRAMTAVDALSTRAAESGPPEIRSLARTFNQLMERVGHLVAQIEHESEQKKDAEMAALRAQITPHFLYNTLNVIKCLAAAGEMDTTQKVAVSLISLMRGSIGSNRDLIPLREELEYVRHYLYLQKLRMDLNFDCAFDIPDALQEVQFPRFTLQMIVENALLHAFSRKSADNRIEIRAFADPTGRTLTVSVSDNGSGMDEKALANLMLDMHMPGRYTFNKVGLHNVNERIRCLFGGEYGLLMQNTGSGLCVEVRIPLRTGALGNGIPAPE